MLGKREMKDDSQVSGSSSWGDGKPEAEALQGPGRGRGPAEPGRVK